MDRPWFRFVPLLLAVTLVAGCAGGSRTRRLSSSVFRSNAWTDPARAHRTPPRAHGARPERVNESASAIVERLHAAGFHFGTDGSPAALWGYLRTSHEPVPPGEAAAGDIIFFDTLSRTGGAQRACGDRVGVVDSVDREGRIAFTEARAGQMQRGYVAPRAPLRRRDDDGQVLNSFLRPKKIGDPDGTRYFAGEMLCGVARVRWRR